MASGYVQSSVIRPEGLEPGTHHVKPDGQAAREVVRPAQARKLEDRLRAVLKGEVRFDDGARALYATDASNYRMPPIGVVIPRDRDDILATVRICREHGAPVLSRGGGTSLAGQCCNTAV